MSNGQNGKHAILCLLTYFDSNIESNLINDIGKATSFIFKYELKPKSARYNISNERPRV